MRDSIIAEDQTNIKWIDPAWPVGCLNRFSALAYFESSPFFDATSLNRAARARGLDPAVPGVLESLGTGLEFVMELAQEPNLFVIRKQLRRSAAEDASRALAILAYYYIIDNEVFQAPTLHATLTCRIRRCLWSLQQGFGRLQTDLDPLLKVLKEQSEHNGKCTAISLPGVTALSDVNGHSSPDQPVSAPLQRPPDDAAKLRWAKTDRIIAHVVNKYPTPTLPPLLDHLQAPRLATVQTTETVDASVVNAIATTPAAELVNLTTPAISVQASGGEVLHLPERLRY